MEHRHIRFHCVLHINAHDSPFADQLTEHCLIGHSVKIFLPECITFLGCIPFGIFQCMCFHFLFGPVHGFSETIRIFKHCIVSDRLCFFPCFLIINQIYLNFFIQWIKSNQFPFLDCQNV